MRRYYQPGPCSMLLYDAKGVILPPGCSDGVKQALYEQLRLATGDPHAQLLRLNRHLPEKTSYVAFAFGEEKMMLWAPPDAPFGYRKGQQTKALHGKGIVCENPETLTWGRAAANREWLCLERGEVKISCLSFCPPADTASVPVQEEPEEPARTLVREQEPGPGGAQGEDAREREENPFLSLLAPPGETGRGDSREDTCEDTGEDTGKKTPREPAQKSSAEEFLAPEALGALTVAKPDGPPRSVRIGNGVSVGLALPLYVGRSPSAGKHGGRCLSVPSANGVVSRTHLLLMAGTVTDLGSANGTFMLPGIDGAASNTANNAVAPRRLPAHVPIPLRCGDRLVLGDGVILTLESAALGEDR
ncbi:hypothetical protein ACUIAC_08145 [Dermabacteraceae bacterium P13138]